MRDLWWNADYLDFLARRLQLGEVRSFVDVGCGLGHFTRLLLPRLAPGATVIAVDFERAWLEGLRERCGDDVPARFLRADAGALPLADDSVDLAACQTLLMHLRDPQRAVAEMVRVVRPGGLVLCAEPNNVHASLRWSQSAAEWPVDELAEVFAFWRYHDRGKAALGAGDSTIGERLPALLAAAGLQDIELRLSDRARPMVPPYDPALLATFTADTQARARGIGAWDEGKLRARVLAGGADEAFFARVFARMRAWADEDVARLAAGSFRSGGAGLHCVCSGRKRRT